MFTFFTKIQQPSIELLGLRIDEPITTLTGIFIAATCFYCCYKLRETDLSHPILKFMYYFQLTLGWSSLLGGILGHAFLYKLGMVWKLPGWELAMISAFAMAQASLLRFYGTERRQAYKKGTWANAISLTVCSVLSAYTLNFLWVEIYTAIGLLAIMSTVEYRLYKSGDRGVSALLLTGMIPMLISVVFIVVKFSASPWFNYFDISHLFICATVVYFFKALQVQSAELAAVQTANATSNILNPESNG